MPSILVLNAGSSSLKCSLFSEGDPPARIGPALNLPSAAAPGPIKEYFAGLFKSVLQQLQGGDLGAIGHRVVHGGTRYDEPTRISADVLDELRRISPFDPQHLPAQIASIEGCALAFPGLPQVACFDTAFHRALPRVSRILPIPRTYEAAGVRRYGFHGLSYAYIVRELGMGAGGRTVIAHLGSGASLAAVLKGKCIDTTMAFTPASGIPMSKRSGDLDPGLAAYLAKTEGMTPERFQEMINSKSGLLGISETSADVRDLLKSEKTDPRAAEALAVFCYSVRKTIGAYAAALGGLDTLVFTGGIGENSDIMRARICDGLGFLGVELDSEWNAGQKAIISKGAVTVRVMHTDEEAEIARSTWEVLKKGHDSKR